VPGDENGFDKESTTPPESVPGAVVPSVDNSTATLKPTLGRIEKRRSGTFGSLASTVSPLKRSDGAMQLDQTGFESPSAKRRSLHSVSGGGLDFSIFDSTDNSIDTSDIMARDFDAQPLLFPSSPAGRFGTIPKRSSSLRRSTLLQRQGDRSIFSRSRLTNVDYSDSSSGSPAPVVQHRMSLDSNLSLASNR
jgi:mitosis inhibitor protein kinase SWE1